MIVIRDTQDDDLTRLDALDFDAPFARKLDGCIGAFRPGYHPDHLVVPKPFTHVFSELCPVTHFGSNIGQGDCGTTG